MGKFSRKADRVIDGPDHMFTFEKMAALESVRQELGFEAMNLVSLCDPAKGADHCQGLLAKLTHPGKYYCFGGLNHATHKSSGKVKAPPLAQQVDQILASGCDGIKMLESKPTMRHELRLELDGPYYADYFARAEELRVPLLWHVADPEEFWDEATAPKWAVEQGWCYNSEYEPKEQIYSEVAAVLKRHSRLKVVFAHFYFLSADLGRARRFFDEYPNVSLDLAPGVEMLYNLSKDPAASRQFFIDYKDRIVYGTDIMAGQSVSEASARAHLVGRFLETADNFPVPPEADVLLGKDPQPFHGLDLPAEVLERIFAKNFLRHVGGAPKKVNRQAAMQECARQAQVASAFAGVEARKTLAGQAMATMETL